MVSFACFVTFLLVLHECMDPDLAFDRLMSLEADFIKEQEDDISTQFADEEEEYMVAPDEVNYDEEKAFDELIETINLKKGASQIYDIVGYEDKYLQRDYSLGEREMPPEDEQPDYYSLPLETLLEIDQVTNIGIIEKFIEFKDDYYKTENFLKAQAKNQFENHRDRSE